MTQEVLTRVAKSIDDWDPDPAKGSFRGWLATITRNLAMQCFRDKARRPVVGISLKEQSGPAANESSELAAFESEHEQQLFAWAARKVQTRFHLRTWQAFWLTAVEGHSIAEVARQLDTTTAQIHVARSRVMSLLRKTIEQSQFDSQLNWNVR